MGEASHQTNHLSPHKSLTITQYGLETAFSEIEPQHHEVTNSGNPICIHLKTRYVMKGIHMEQTMSSKVNVWYDDATGKIVEIWAPWDGSLPESSFKDVSLLASLLRLCRWLGFVAVKSHMEHVIIPCHPIANAFGGTLFHTRCLLEADIPFRSSAASTLPRRKLPRKRPSEPLCSIQQGTNTCVFIL